MTPAFITPDYIEACRAATFIQGWWTATWTYPKMRWSDTPGNQPGVAWDPDEVSRGFRAKHTPPWALPAVGTGLQCNVRTGDLVDAGFGVAHAVGAVSYDDVGVSHVSASPFEEVLDATKLVFLPRLDQLIAIAGFPYMNPEGDLFKENDVLLWLLGDANADLKELGCPERTP